MPDPVNPFSSLPSGLQGQLRPLFQERRFASGEHVFLQEGPTTHIYLVAQGRVKISRVTHEGFESVLCVRQAGEFFCPVSVLDGGPQLGSAVAVGEVTLLSADARAFHEMCQACPELLSRVQRECLAEVRSLMHRLESFATRSVTARVAAALFDQARRATSPTDGPIEIHLTQQELAGLAGCSRESVSRVLGRLRRMHMLEVRRGQVRVLDLERLRRLANKSQA